MTSCKILNTNETDIINNCISKHATCYGVTIDHSALLKRIENIIENGCVWGIFDKNHCLGICSQIFWKKIPAWVMSNLYLNIDTTNLYMKKKILKL